MARAIGQGRGHRHAVGLERDRHARDSRCLPAVLHPVAVHVHQHATGDATRLVVARVHRVVRLPRGQREDRAQSVGRARIAVQVRVRTRPGHRVGVTAGQAEARHEAARHHVREAVSAAARTDVRGQRRQCAQAAVGAVKDHAHASQTNFAAVLHAVAVGVHPHVITDGHRLRVQEVVARRTLPAGQRQRDLVVVAALRVARAQVAAGIGFDHRVTARRQIGEAVVARAVGQGRGHRHPVGLKRERHAAEPRRLPAVLHAIAVGVHQHAARHAARLVVARVHRVVRLTRGQREDRAQPVGRARVTVQVRVPARPRHRVGVTRGQAEARHKAARHHVREAVGTRPGTDVRSQGRQRAQAAVGAVEHHAHASQTHFPAVLHAVAVGVHPDVIAEGHWLCVKKVVPCRTLPTRQGQRDLVVVAALRVARAQVAGQIGFDHRVAARRQVGEAVVARAVGQGRGHRHAVGLERDRHAADPRRLPAVLHAVAVGVHQHAPRHATRLVVARINRVVRLTRGQREDRAQAVGPQRVAVQVRVRTRPRHRVGVTRGQTEARHKAARHHIREAVGAAGGTDVGRQSRERAQAAIGAIEDHAHAGQTNLTAVLHAIVIGVHPHVIADGHRLRIQEVVPRRALPAGQRQRDLVVVAALRVARAQVASGISFDHCVAARRQVRETVIAAAIG